MSFLLNKLGKTLFQAKSSGVLLGNFNLVESLCIHTSSVDFSFRTGPRKFLQHNKTKFEPQTPQEEPRKAVY